MKERLLHVLELSTGPISVVDSFELDEKATQTLACYRHSDSGDVPCEQRPFDLSQGGAPI